MEAIDPTEPQSPHFGTDWLLEATGDAPVIFQDLLDAGCALHEVEALSDHARALGHSPVTVSVFLELTEDNGELQSRVLPHILGRLKHAS